MTHMAEFLATAGRRLRTSLGKFTTDPAVRVGILQAAWSVAPSFARGLLPRSPSHEAVIVGVNGTAQYAIGTTAWAGISTLAAGVPGHHAGRRALLVASLGFGLGGLAIERSLRPRSGKNIAVATAWAAAKVTSTTSLAGGLVITSDVIAHDVLKRKPGILTTLALDIAAGTVMASGTLVRRHLRARKFGVVEQERHAVARAKSPQAYASMVGISAGTTVAIAGLAVSEQALSRAVDRGLSRALGLDLGETGVLLGHGIAAIGFSAAAYGALKQVRARMLRDNEVYEAAYPEQPESERVSCGPNSHVDFDAIGKEGRRFVLMALDNQMITNVMGEPALDPIRAVIPREGSIEDRAELAVQELDALGGFERSMIVVASPTGVGYVNYIMAEALEYLTRGNCAIVVPQYAMLPSFLALDTTKEGTRLQGAVLDAIHQRIQRIPEVRRPRIFQFGESLGAQVALDVAAQGGVHRLDRLSVEGGLYLGVPFRSTAWNVWREDPEIIDPDHRIVLAPDCEAAPQRRGMHLMVIHDDDPVNKFSYSMAVKRPYWFGRPETRPPKVPREVLFRPISSFVISLVDLMNGMDQSPGSFQRVGHDYRIDMRESLEKVLGLRTSKVQAEAIEHHLRSREEMWAQARMVARNLTKALNTISATLDKWGQPAMTVEFAEQQGYQMPPLLQKARTQGILNTLGETLSSGTSDPDPSA